MSGRAHLSLAVNPPQTVRLAALMSRAGFEAFLVSLFFLDGVDQVGFLHLAGGYFHLLSYFFDFLDFHFAFSSLFIFPPGWITRPGCAYGSAGLN